jgi:hypothetical protein
LTSLYALDFNPETVSWGGVYVDFSRVITSVTSFMVDQGHPYALIGGLAMAAYGMVRTTLDVDLVTTTEAQEGLVEFLESMGFDTVYRSSGYSNHHHSDSALGGVDVVYVQGTTGQELFSAVRTVAGPDETSVPVLSAEHLAAMKIFAIKNDPTRTFAELEDIRFLLTLPGVDRNEIRGYFEKHGLGNLYAELE